MEEESKCACFIICVHKQDDHRACGMNATFGYLKIEGEDEVALWPLRRESLNE